MARLGAARILVALAFLAVAPALADVPHAAYRYRADLIRNSRLAWGLDAPVASFAAQIQQESGWNPRAVSRVGARGMAQFMPATATWWCGLNKVADCAPENPVWAMRALAGYDKWLWERVPRAADECARMALALRGYNGGLGYVQREAKTGKPCTAFRSAANCRENLDYPRRILDRFEPVYVRGGFGRGVCA